MNKNKSRFVHAELVSATQNGFCHIVI